MRRNMAGLLVISVVLFANVAAQVRMQPQPAPDTSATNESWYLSGEPIAVFGDFYYPTGPTVYFNANHMVPTATFGRVTLYADTTLEPYSMVFVPIGRGLMRPYEKRRAGPLAGTVGSTTPSFPVQPSSEARDAVNPQLSPSAALPIFPNAVAFPTDMFRPAQTLAVGTSGASANVPKRPPEPTHMATLEYPASNDGVWIEFQGSRWRAAGKAEEFSADRFVRYGEYKSFPVYVERNRTEAGAPIRIFLPVVRGHVTPYERVR